MDKSSAARAAEQCVRGVTTQIMCRRFTEAQSSWVEGHLKMMCELRRVFGNDLDKVIILAVIGQRMLRDALQEHANYEVAETGEISLDRSRLTNIESIAVSTGIPRESVRRKVMELLDIGWIERDEKGRLAVHASATQSLAGVTATTMDALDGVFASFAGLMADEELVHFTSMKDSREALAAPVRTA